MNRYLFVLIATALATIGLVVSAQSRPGDSKPTVFKNARIIDGSGKPAIESATLIIRDGKIESISRNAEIPKDAELIDASGKTIIPALIAGHSHLGLIQGSKSSTTFVTEENVRRQLRQYAAYGIGAVVSLGADEKFIYPLRDRPQGGPRIFTADQGFGVAGGAPPEQALGPVHRPETADEARAMVREIAKSRPDFIKIWIDDFDGKFPIKMKREIQRAIIDEAHQQKLRSAAHVYYLSDAKALVTDGIDLLAHSIRDQPVDDELIAAMKEKNTAYIATLFLDEAFFAYADQPDWMKTDFFKKALEPGVEELLQPGTFKPKATGKQVLAMASQNLKRLHAAGIKIGLGTDSGANVYRVQGFAEHRELQLLVAAGLTPLEAIQSATRNNAEILGVSATLGSLEPGKSANLLILNADPSIDIANTTQIDSLWLEGKRQ